MAVHRVHKTKDYTVISNYHLRDKEMSLKTKGLLSLMLSLPDTWDYSISGLTAIVKEGSSTIRAGLTELEKLGYLKRTAIRENGKIIDWQYDIFEKPLAEKPHVEKPQVENPQVEKPQVENRTQLNTNKHNKDLSNKDKQNKDIYKYIIYIVEYLNSKVGTSYKPTSKATQQHINARFKEGYTVDDFKKVIDNKCADWKGGEFEQYLRPSTLFGTKFENYLNATPKKQVGANGIKIDPKQEDDLDGIF